MVSSALMGERFQQCVILFCCFSCLIFDILKAAGAAEHQLRWRAPPKLMVTTNVINSNQQTVFG